ncbi:MAG: acyl-CoA carboxylase subunit epsilon [Mycobacteriales bacterium]
MTTNDRPHLRIVRGNPTEEELAALVTVLAARPAPGPPTPRTRPLWNDPATLLRRPHHPGPNAWRASALPR